MTRRLSLVFGMGMFALVAASCESKTHDSVSIGGTIKLDGKPLPSGEVYFSLPGQVPSIFQVKDGSFVGEVKQGTHRVEICAYRARKDVVAMPGQNMTPPPENYIPEKYNAKSELTAEVVASGSNQFNFDLSSK